MDVRACADEQQEDEEERLEVEEGRHIGNQRGDRSVGELSASISFVEDSLSSQKSRRRAQDSWSRTSLAFHHGQARCA